MALENPRGTVSAAGPVKAGAQMSSGRKNASVLRQELKGESINFTFSSKLRKIISWLEQRSEIN